MLAMAPDFSSAARVAAGKCFTSVPRVLLKNISISAWRAVCGPDGTPIVCDQPLRLDNSREARMKVSLGMTILRLDALQSCHSVARRSSYRRKKEKPDGCRPYSRRGQDDSPHRLRAIVLTCLE